jgi:hypothetical protein
MRQLADTLSVDAAVAFAIALIAILTWFAVTEMRYRSGLRLERVSPDRLVGLIFTLVAPFGWVWFGASDIAQSLGGYWRATDFRSSDLFVTLNWGVILVIAPLASLFGLYILWTTRHQR